MPGAGEAAGSAPRFCPAGLPHLYFAPMVLIFAEGLFRSRITCSGECWDLDDTGTVEVRMCNARDSNERKALGRCAIRLSKSRLEALVEEAIIIGEGGLQ